MPKPGSERALALSKRDQAMEGFKEHKAQLESIYNDGPQCEEDIKFIKTCLAFVLAEVIMVQAEEKDSW